MRNIGSPYVDKGMLRAFLKDPVLKELEIIQIEQKSAKNNDVAASRAPSFKRRL
jgi:hypothetical protein